MIKYTYKEVKLIIENKDGKLLTNSYTNNTQPLVVECKCGYRWTTCIKNIKSGGWCHSCAGQRRYTKEELVEICKKKNFIYISGTYKNAKSKITLSCKLCNKQWASNLGRINAGNGCPNCSRKQKPKYSYDFVNKEIQKRGGKLISKEFRGMLYKIYVECKCCKHIWGTTFNNIFNQKKWCAKCAGVKKYTIKEIHSILKKKNCLLLDNEYKNKDKYMRILCQNCNNIYMQTLRNILTGSGCNRCSKYTQYSYAHVKEIIENNDGKLLSSEYYKVMDKITISCNKCNYTWDTRFDNIINGSWCPKCSSCKTQNNLANIIKDIFPDYSIKENYRKIGSLKNISTGRNLEIDIFVEDIGLAIEYDGEQHFVPVRFGGISKSEAIKNLNNIKKLDVLKNKLIVQSDEIKYFIRFSYKEKQYINHSYVINKLLTYGVRCEVENEV